MPYVSKERRVALNAGAAPAHAGELNYLISRIAHDYALRGESYQRHNDVLGAIEGAKLELYSRVTGPYESSKALMNGALEGGHDVAWAAGFFDGEGNINHTLQRDRQGNLRPKGRVQITVVQKTPLLLLRFKEAVGGIGYIRPPCGTTTCWHYTVAKFDDLFFVVETLWPYLGPIKREQALGALRKWEGARDLTLGLPEVALDSWPVQP